jgi:hypothetical protein
LRRRGGNPTASNSARIVAEENVGFVETQEALDHENAATTRVYGQRIMIKADNYSTRIAQRIKHAYNK